MPDSITIIDAQSKTLIEAARIKFETLWKTGLANLLAGMDYGDAAILLKEAAPKRAGSATSRKWWCLEDRHQRMYSPGKGSFGH
jgi:hypothetical protein